ncbi:MAG: SDR family oxidoreductase [Meiothermus sp.]|nr:SDR family oxidoreductase [Meiothermus sp.]
MGKVLLITGGSRGIGAATARLAAAQGYAIAVNYQRNAAAAQAVVAELEAAGARAIAVQADVALEAEVLRMFETVDAELGRLTHLVNNAGILEQQMRLEQMSLGRMRAVFDTNILGSFLCAREAVRRMSARNGGSGGAIVNVSSAASRLGSPNEYIDYAASKGAIDTLTLGLSKEVAAEGIRVNAVRPGIIHTEIHARGGEPGRADRLAPLLPVRRSGTAEEVAECIVWLLSDAASYVTGALLDVAGGR